MTVCVKRNKGTTAALKGIERAAGLIRVGIRSALYTIGAEDVRHLQRLITNPPKTGRFYGKHQASAPGEAPANRTGRLAKSADFIVRGTSQLEVGEKAPYAKFLEEGTKKMEPRPHVARTRQERSKEAFMTLSQVPLASLRGKRVK